jgi:hypothetical protein
MGVNKNIQDLRNNIIQLMNESGFPMGVLYYIIKDIYNETTSRYDYELAQENKEEETNSEEEKVDENIEIIKD